MSWVNLFLGGLFLALSPFNLNTGHYFFFYSLLGYGLVAVSYLFRKKTWQDWTVFSVVLVIIAAGASNLFSIYYLFQLLFFLSVAVFYAAESRQKAIYAVALVMTGLCAFLLAVHFGNLIGFRSFRLLVLNAHYFFLSLIIAMILTDYPEWRSRETRNSSGQAHKIRP